MRCTKVKLGEVCEFIRGVTFDKAEATTTPEAGKLPILRAGNIGEKLDSQNDLVWVPTSRVSGEQRLRRNDIAICMSSGSPEVVGKTARVPANLSASIGSFCGIIRPHRSEEAAFLSFYFRSSAFAEQRDAIARGANIQNLRFSQLEGIEVEIPANQRQIAGQLEQADRLRRTRRYALELSDAFLPAAFHQLFGDLESVESRWPIESLGDSLEAIEGGINFNPVDENAPASDWRVLKVSAVSRRDFLAEESKPISPTEQFDEKLIVRLGDLIMSRANTVALVGAVARVRTPPPPSLAP